MSASEKEVRVTVPLSISMSPKSILLSSRSSTVVAVILACLPRAEEAAGPTLFTLAEKTYLSTSGAFSTSISIKTGLKSRSKAEQLYPK